MLEQINLNNWITKEEAYWNYDLDYSVETGKHIKFKTFDVEFRDEIRKHNKLFNEGKVDKYIAHSRKGYRYTTDETEIFNSIKDNQRQAINMLYKVSQTHKRLNRKNQLELELRELGVI